MSIINDEKTYFEKQNVIQSFGSVKGLPYCPNYLVLKWCMKGKKVLENWKFSFLYEFFLKFRKNIKQKHIMVIPLVITS